MKSIILTVTKNLDNKRERNLLFNKEMDSINNLKLVKLVVCHELAHQWVI